MLQISFPEGLVNDQVEDHLLDIIILVCKLIVQVDGLAGLYGDFYLHFVTSEVDAPVDGLIDLLEGEDCLACGDEGTDGRLDLLPFGTEDS